MEEGALKDYPCAADLARGMSNRMAAQDFQSLFDKLEKNGWKASLTYLELCMMYRFFTRLANRLMIAVAININNLSPLQFELWNYPVYSTHKLIVFSQAESVDNLVLEDD